MKDPSDASNLSEQRVNQSIDTGGTESGQKEVLEKKVISRGSLISGSIEGNRLRYTRLPSMKVETSSNTNINKEQDKDFSVEPEMRQTHNTHMSNPASYRGNKDLIEDNNHLAIFDFSAKPVNSHAALKNKQSIKPKMFIQSNRKLIQNCKIRVENVFKVAKTSMLILCSQ